MLTPLRPHVKSVLCYVWQNVDPMASTPPTNDDTVFERGGAGTKSADKAL